MWGLLGAIGFASFIPLIIMLPTNGQSAPNTDTQFTMSIIIFGIVVPVAVNIIMRYWVYKDCIEIILKKQQTVS